ncbi:hypothetical protein I3J27_33410 [Bradyrhizobium xenonodulans]|uniref:Uncharacterized protein n=1 Tax=Bradyrhizobium xenonodulans TaxID=2736875 RepID=A0ABY7MJQ5_9BRAD|nr:hypothetical protein [Bradyrhizobium xenonodulans]WBL77846.1 hypothetical protein I3J27_33410 [Bradyrhizobium xenonodulans]
MADFEKRSKNMRAWLELVVSRKCASRHLERGHVLGGRNTKVYRSRSASGSSACQAITPHPSWTATENMNFGKVRWLVLAKKRARTTLVEGGAEGYH